MWSVTIPSVMWSVTWTLGVSVVTTALRGVEWLALSVLQQFYVCLVMGIARQKCLSLGRIA